jgi:hypothetical protein
MTKKRKEIAIILSVIAGILSFFSLLVYLLYLDSQLPDEYTHNNLAFVGVELVEDVKDDAYIVYIFRDSHGDIHHLFGEVEIHHYLQIETNYRVSYTMNNEEFPKNYRIQDVIPVDAVEEE